MITIEALSNIIEYTTNIVANGGWPVGFLLVFIEAFLPILPLCVFVTLNVNAFGFLPGVILSWISTTIGCYTMYLICYYLSNKIFKYLKPSIKEKVQAKTKIFKNIKLTHLALIITLPFTPSCFINLLAGVTAMSKEKYIIALLIGKSLMITFWAYIGKSFIESLQDIKALIFIGIMLVIAYGVSKIVSKKLEIE